MSYSGAEAPLTPLLSAARRLPARVRHAHAGRRERRWPRCSEHAAQRKSVLDFVQRDHARLQQLAPASQREQLDMHAAAIREVEIEFDAMPVDPASCAVPAAPEVLSVSTQLDPYSGNHVVPQRDDETHSRIGALHMAVIKAAFRCDLTRVVTFQWAPGTNHVSFGDLWPPDPTVFKVHHTDQPRPGLAGPDGVLDAGRRVLRAARGKVRARAGGGAGGRREWLAARQHARPLRHGGRRA